MSIKRIIKDVTQLMKEPLISEGIYYKHDEENIYKGYALIIGPKNTLYQYGFYMFKLDFPENYPTKPPLVTYLTNNYKIRFHPNLYRNGKCCLSILNTWNGEQWSSCQSISTILLSLVLLFNNNPLLNEPGITKNHEDFQNYNKIIQYYNYLTAFYEVGTNKLNTETYDIFKDIITKHYNNNKTKVINHIQNLNINKQNIFIKIYSINAIIDYDKLLQKLN